MSEQSFYNTFVFELGVLLLCTYYDNAGVT